MPRFACKLVSQEEMYWTTGSEEMYVHLTNLTTGSLVVINHVHLRLPKKLKCIFITGKYRESFK